MVLHNFLLTTAYHLCRSIQRLLLLKSLEIGQLLWLCWQSSLFRCQRSAFRILSLSKLYNEHIHCWKDEKRKGRPGMAYFYKKVKGFFIWTISLNWIDTKRDDIDEERHLPFCKVITLFYKKNIFVNLDFTHNRFAWESENLGKNNISIFSNEKIKAFIYNDNCYFLR